MIDFLTTLLAFAVAISLLIAVHEYGHYIVARLSGVKVLRFSIGFGKPLASWRGRGPDATEYAVAAIPLGGYVKMLDEREGEVKEEELHRAFNRQPVGKRFAIVAAGPVFNFLFAILAYWLMFVTGVPGMKAMIGEVEPGTIAARAGLSEGQVIVAVQGEPTPTWGSVLDQMLPAALRNEPVALTIEEGGAQSQRMLPLQRIDDDADPQELVKSLGFRPYRPVIEPVMGEIVPGSPADAAGLQAGDRVVAVDGETVERWSRLVELVQASPEQPLSMAVQRGDERLELQVRPERRETAQGPIGKIGAGPQVDQARFEALRAELRYGPLDAAGRAVAKTWDMGVLTLEMLGKMVVGQASVENLSGPITIASYAKQAAVAGFTHFLNLLALISLSLGVLNLLPIPVLDGGHLMFYVVEIFKGRPVSQTAEMVGQKVGIAIILMLMTLALYNDMARLLQ